MPRPVKITLLSLVTLFGLLILGLVVLTQLPQRVYKSWIIDAVQSATGRELSIGDFELVFGANISLRATAIRFANADWATEPEMVVVKELLASLAVRPLMAGSLDYLVNIASPQINLETNAEGRSNWELAGDEPEHVDRPWVPGQGLMLVKYFPRELDVDDLQLRIDNKLFASHNEVSLSRLRLGDVGGMLTLDATGEVDGDPVKLAGTLGSIKRILSGESTPVQIKGHLAQLSWTMTGNWSKARSRAGPTLDLTVEATVATTRFFQPFVAIPVPELGRLDYAVTIVGSEGAYRADKLNLKLSGGPAEVEAKGGIGDLAEFSKIAIQLKLTTREFPEIMSGFGLDLPVDLPRSVNASGVVKGSLTELSLADVRGDLSDRQVRGRISGAVENVITRAGLHADVEIKADSLTALSKFTGQDLPDLGPVEATGQIQFKDDVYSLANIDANLLSDEVVGELKGEIGDLAKVSGLDLRLSANTSSLAQLSRLAGRNLPNTTAFEMTAKLAAAEGPAGPSTVRAQVIGDSLRVDTEGTITSMTTIDGLDLAVQAETDSLSQLLAAAGVDWSGVGRTTANFTLMSSDDGFNSDDLSIQLGHTDLRGTLRLTPGGGTKRPALQGQFHSKVFDLNNLLGVDDYVEARTERNKAIEETGVVAPPTGRFLFTDQPIPFAALNRIDVDLEFDADRIDVGNLQIKSGHATLNLKAGDLQFLVHRANVKDRTVDGALQVDARQTPASVAFNFNADDVPLSHLLGPGALFQGGRLLLEVAATAQGRSGREIASSLNGTLRLVVQDSRMPNSLFARFGRSVLMQVNPFSANKTYSQVECAAIDAAISDGLLKTPRGLVLQTDAVTWTGSGSLDLKTEKINVALHAKAREGLGIGAGSLAELVAIRGTLNQPTMEPDPKGVAKQGLGLALAVGTGGLSLLAEGLWDRTMSQTELCDQIVTGFRNRPLRGIGTQ